MATITSAHTFFDAFVAALRARPGLSGVQVQYVWPGPSATKEMIACGDEIQATSEIPNIKAGRVQRQEAYTFDVIIWVFQPEQKATTGQTTANRAFTLFDEVDGTLADDVKAGDTGIQWAAIGSWTRVLRPYEKGWACELTAQVTVQARLT